VPVVNVAVHHQPARQHTPQPSREQDLDDKLAEAQAEVGRLRTLLAAMPEPKAKEEEEPQSEPSGPRRRHHRSPSTVTGTETEVSSYVDEPYQPEGVPLQIVIIIALGVFVTTYLFF
jgi:vesicle-associated membrane protein-associated protein A